MYVVVYPLCVCMIASRIDLGSVEVPNLCLVNCVLLLTPPLYYIVLLDQELD